MDKFKEIRDKIGKDLTLRLPSADQKAISSIVLDWEFIIGIDSAIFRVADDYRINKLSTENHRYTVILFTKEKDGKIYPSVQNYMPYIFSIFKKANLVMADFEFIYVWDNEFKKIIIVWENDYENNQFRMNEEMARACFSNDNDYKNAKKSPNLEII